MGITNTKTTKLLKGTTTMAKNNKPTNEAKAPKTPRDYSKAVVVVKVIALVVLGMASLYMAGMLTISAAMVQVLGYGLMAVTIYFMLSSVK